MLISAAVAIVLTAVPAHSVQDRPAFRTTVARVQVDVIVTGKEGSFLDDLGPGDFSVFEDGTPQELLDVELVDLGARTKRQLEYRTAREADDIPGVPTDVKPGDLGAVVFLIDMPGLYSQNKIRFADALVSFLEHADRLRVPYAAYVVNQLGHLYELEPLTDSVERLLRASRDLRAAPLIRTRDDILSVVESHLSPISDPARSVAGQRRLNIVRERARGLDTLDMLSRVTSSLSARRGRTALVWVSSGFELGSANVVERVPRGALADSELRQPPSAWVAYQPDPQVENQMEALYASANTSNVSIYTVDPSLLIDFIPSRGSTRAGSSADTAGNSLRHVAASTGGKAFVGATDLQAVLQAIETDASRFYLLTYAPQHDADGAYHEIRVEVDRPDATARARAGYFHYSEDDRWSRIVRGALDLPGVVSGVPVGVAAIRARNASGQGLLVVDVAVEPEQTPAGGAAALPNGSAPLLVFEAVRDPDEKLVASKQGEMQQAEGSPSYGALLGDRLERTASTHHAVFALDPGSYEVRIAVADPRTGRLGTAAFETEITDAGGAWDASDPWLAVEHRGGPMTSVIEGAVPVGQAVGVYLEVYHGLAPTLSARILAGGGGIVTGGPPSPEQDVPGIALQPDQGVHRGTLSLPRLPVGDYVVEIRVVDAGADMERIMRLSLHVRPSDQRERVPE